MSFPLKRKAGPGGERSAFCWRHLQWDVQRESRKARVLKCRNPGWDTHTFRTVFVSPSDRVGGSSMMCVLPAKSCQKASLVACPKRKEALWFFGERNKLCTLHGRRGLRQGWQ